MGKAAYMQAMKDEGSSTGESAGDRADTVNAKAMYAGKNPVSDAIKDAKFLRKSLQGAKFNEPMSPDEEKEYASRYGGGDTQLASK